MQSYDRPCSIFGTFQNVAVTIFLYLILYYKTTFLCFFQVLVQALGQVPAICLILVAILLLLEGEAYSPTSPSLYIEFIFLLNICFIFIFIYIYSNTMSLSGATSDQANLQQHLKLLTHNPYGDSSLFMNLNDVSL